MSDVQLVIAGKAYGGWTSIRIMRSLEAVADTFDLSLTDRWSDQKLPMPIPAGAACEVAIDGERVITGYIDEVSPEYDGSHHAINVRGRSKAGDLVDCSIAGADGKGLQWRGKTLLAIASELCGRFGISVSALTDVGGGFKSVALEPGETIWEFIEHLARIRAVRFVSTTDGNMAIVRAGQSRVKTALTLGENIRLASGQFSTIERFSDYIVQAQQTGDDDTWGEQSAHVHATAKDNGVGRYRPTVIVSDTPGGLADCKQRAEWQRNTAWGRGQGVVYTVTDWAHSDGLWAPNTLVDVDDRWLGIKAARLIMSAQYILNDQGLRTELRVLPKEAADLVPLPEDKNKDDDSGRVR